MIEVEIWSDIACPFCFIGKKNFEAALSGFQKRDQVKVTWKSFELDPNAPKSQKIQIHDVLAKKYGRSPEWARQMNQNMAEKGKDVGITFQFDQIIPTNSFDAHRLLHLASQHGKQNQVSELLFSAYFTEGKDIADHSVLTDIGARAGLDLKVIDHCLSTDQFTQEVRNDEDEAHSFQISGVPAFVFNRKYLVSGAQPPEAFSQVLQEVTEEQSVSK